ncbi:unnamed protein product [Musa textilis]
MRDTLMGGWVFNRETEEKPGRCSDPRLPPCCLRILCLPGLNCNSHVWPPPFTLQGLHHFYCDISPIQLALHPSGSSNMLNLLHTSASYESIQCMPKRKFQCSMAPTFGRLGMTMDIFDKQNTLLQYAHGMKCKAPYLETLHDARNDLVLQTGVLPLGILPDHHNIHPLMPGRQPLEVEAMDERRVEIEFLSQLHVEGADPPPTGVLRPPPRQTLFLRIDSITSAGTVVMSPWTS